MVVIDAVIRSASNVCLEAMFEVTRYEDMGWFFIGCLSVFVGLFLCIHCYR